MLRLLGCTYFHVDVHMITLSCRFIYDQLSRFFDCDPLLEYPFLCLFLALHMPSTCNVHTNCFIMLVLEVPSLWEGVVATAGLQSRYPVYGS